MNRLIITILVLAALLFPLTAAADGNVPAAAKCIGKELDSQLMDRFGGIGGVYINGQKVYVTRDSFLIIGTTPANLNNLAQASPLARQMTEEISRYLMDQGYRYDEIRKGRVIRFDPKVGEFILTRNVPQLATSTAVGQAILAGTYVVSGEDVRFNISLIATDSNEVLAKASATVPITPDLRPLLVENQAGDGGGMLPSVYTRLQ